MRKLTVTLTFILLLSLTYQIHAQRFGVKGGLNVVNMKLENNSDNSLKLGFHLGPTAEFPLGDIFSVETGVLLTTKGTKWKTEPAPNVENTHKINLTYLEFPVYGKAGYDFGSTRVYGFIGPYVGVGISGKLKSKFDNDGDITKTTDKLDLGSDGDYKRMDVGMTIGACAAVNIFEVGFNYSHGFADISTGNNYAKHRVFSIFMAYKFGKKLF